MDKIKVNMISESGKVKEQGVHTAFIENLRALEERPDVDIKANTNRRADLIHIQTIGPYSMQKLLFDRGKKVVSAHVTPDSFVGSLVGARYWYKLAQLYLRWFYNRADAVLAVSQEVAFNLKEFGVKKPIYVVPNTIDTSVFRSKAAGKQELRRRLGLPELTFTIMGSGQVQPRKGIDSFIRCARELPQYQFVWVGGIPFKKLAADYERMRGLMEEKLPNLRFTGIISRPDVIAYYQAADLFFLPSHQETFGLVIVEAAAAGIPVLLRDLVQYRQTFKGGYVASKEENFLQQIRHLATDKAYYEHWQTQSAQIASTYDSGAGAGRLLEVYHQVLAQQT